MEVALEAGADDVKDATDVWEVQTDPAEFISVLEAIKEQGLQPVEAQLTKLPSTTVDVTDENDARKILALAEALDEADDVQAVYSNFDIPEEMLAKLED
jgi:transcriptional/translational regulatory protein YebC/TACO1